MSQKRLSQRPKTSFVECYAPFMSRAFRYFFLLLWVASGVTEISTAGLEACEIVRGKRPIIRALDAGDGLSVTEEERKHAQQLARDALILFSHDHVLTPGHFQDARAGGLTAMTMELTVDNMKWIDASGMETVGPVGSGAVQFTIVSSFPFETMDNARMRFSGARKTLMDIIDPQGSGFRIVRTVQDIDVAKANGELGIIIGTEGALMLADNYSVPMGYSSWEQKIFENINESHMKGWRKVQLYRGYKTPFVNIAPDWLSVLGKRTVSMLNKRGVVIDAMHLSPGHIDDLFAQTNAPLQISHDWNVCEYGYKQYPNRPDLVRKIVASGGGHGVISLNALTYAYLWCGHRTGIRGFVDTLVDLIDEIGVDHVGIGPDYMPEGGANAWTLPSTPGTPIPIVGLIAELRTRNNPNTGMLFSDEDIKK